MCSSLSYCKGCNQYSSFLLCLLENTGPNQHLLQMQQLVQCSSCINTSKSHFYEPVFLFNHHPQCPSFMTFFSFIIKFCQLFFLIFFSFFSCFKFFIESDSLKIQISQKAYLYTMNMLIFIKRNQLYIEMHPFTNRTQKSRVIHILMEFSACG